VTTGLATRQRNVPADVEVPMGNVPGDMESAVFVSVTKIIPHCPNLVRVSYISVNFSFEILRPINKSKLDLFYTQWISNIF